MHLSKTGNPDAQRVVVNPGHHENRRGDESTPFCCIECSDTFWRQPGEEDKRTCQRCLSEGKEEPAGDADARAHISPPKSSGPLPARRAPKEPDPENPRALIRPPESKMNLAEAGRLRKERISALSARLRTLQNRGEGDGEMAAWLRAAILYQQGQGPEPGPQPRRNPKRGKGKP